MRWSPIGSPVTSKSILPEIPSKSFEGDSRDKSEANQAPSTGYHTSSTSARPQHHGPPYRRRQRDQVDKAINQFDHISAYLRDVLHWLPLRQRIEFKVAVLVWYSLIGQAPA